MYIYICEIKHISMLRKLSFTSIYHNISEEGWKKFEEREGRRIEAAGREQED